AVSTPLRPTPVCRSPSTRRGPSFAPLRRGGVPPAATRDLTGHAPATTGPRASPSTPSCEKGGSEARKPFRCLHDPSRSGRALLGDACETVADLVRVRAEVVEPRQLRERLE